MVGPAPSKDRRTSGTIRVALADDHPLVRTGLRHVLERAGGMEVVAEAGDGRTLLRQVEELQPAVVIADVSMPELNGIDAARAIRQRSPRTRVLVLSVHCTEEAVIGAVEAGAAGYVVKDASSEELEQAVRAVANNESYFSPAAARLLATQVARREPRGTHLSAREREVVQLLSEGRRINEVATKLCISAQTVKSHRANAMRKLGARSTAELIRYAIRSGLAPL